MTRISLAIAIAFLLGTGCGDPSCEDAVRKAAKLMGRGGIGYGGSMSEDDIQSGIRECKEAKWSASTRNCIYNASSARDLMACNPNKN